MPPDLRLRPLLSTDSIEDLTAVLHRAYAPLAAAGFRFVATHQTPEVTRKRCDAGECMVAEVDGRIVGTITYYARPMEESRCPLYARPDVARFGQFGVEPDLQRGGVGSMLLMVVETIATFDGFAHLALDTAEGASDLIAYYRRRGYVDAGHVRWDSTNYRSLLLAKALRPRPGPANDR
jgi:GNAT superfamily N-acetyltransferase